MPQRSAIDKKKLELYKKDLMKLREDLSHDINNMSKNPTSEDGEIREGAAGHVQHMADVATDMYDKEFSIGLASHDRETLYRISEALERLDEGTFGACVECKKSISVARLKAIPYADTCLPCQEKLETKRR